MTNPKTLNVATAMTAPMIANRAFVESTLAWARDAALPTKLLGLVGGIEGGANVICGGRDVAAVGVLENLRVYESPEPGMPAVI